MSPYRDPPEDNGDWFNRPVDEKNSLAKFERWVFYKEVAWKLIGIACFFVFWAGISYLVCAMWDY